MPAVLLTASSILMAVTRKAGAFQLRFVAQGEIVQRGITRRSRVSPTSTKVVDQVNGIVLADRQRIGADIVLAATGAWTPLVPALDKRLFSRNRDSPCFI